MFPTEEEDHQSQVQEQTVARKGKKGILALLFESVLELIDLWEELLQLPPDSPIPRHSLSLDQT